MAAKVDISKFVFESQNYKVFITPEYFVDVSVWGTWTEQEADGWAAAIGACTDALHQAGLKSFLLYDASGLDLMKFATPRVLRKILDHFNELSFEVVALFHGKIMLFRSMLNMMVKVYPSLGRIRPFATKSDAESYLRTLDMKR